MRLTRHDKSVTSDPENPNDYVRNEHRFEKDKLEGILRVDFPEFGHGPKRRPGFAVELDWHDVKSFLMAFIEMGEHDAVYIHRLFKLAEMVEQAGWSPTWAPTAGLLESIPPHSN
jgi:hypothetical protein